MEAEREIKRERPNPPTAFSSQPQVLSNEQSLGYPWKSSWPSNCKGHWSSPIPSAEPGQTASLGRFERGWLPKPGFRLFDHPKVDLNPKVPLLGKPPLGLSPLWGCQQKGTLPQTPIPEPGLKSCRLLQQLVEGAVACRLQTTGYGYGSNSTSYPSIHLHQNVTIGFDPQPYGERVQLTSP